MFLVFWCNRRFCILSWISNNLMLQWQPINAFNTNSNWAKYLSFAYIVILCRLFTENNLSISSFLPLTLMYRKIASLANIVMQNDFPSVDRRSCFKYIYFCCCSVYVCFFLSWYCWKFFNTCSHLNWTENSCPNNWLGIWRSFWCVSFSFFSLFCCSLLHHYVRLLLKVNEIQTMANVCWSV